MVDVFWFYTTPDSYLAGPRLNYPTVRKLLYTLLLLLAAQIGFAQSYAERLVAQLSEEYNLPAGVIATRNDELATLTEANTYGANSSFDSVEAQPFRYVHRLRTPDTVTVVFGHASIIEVIEPIAAGDRGVFSFWIRGLAADSISPANVQAWVERSEPEYNKFGGGTLVQEFEWRQIFIPFRVQEDFPVGSLHVPIQIGKQNQTVEIAGAVLINYGQAVPYDSLPSNFQDTTYVGREADAPWRAAAAERIERNRKADLTLEVVDDAGDPLAGRNVRIRMTRNAFGFGSAVVANRFAGGTGQDATYESKLRAIDAAGNRFTEVVFENDLKWDFWEDERLSTQEHTVEATNFLIDSLGMEVRGHNLLWPCNLPPDVEGRITDTAFVLQRIRDRFETILTAPGIQGRLLDWDLINEIAVCEDLARAFSGQGEYVTGREFFPDIFRLAKRLDPEAKYYYNDYQVLQYGGDNSVDRGKFLRYARELIDSGAPLEGIGLQAHMVDPVPPATIVELLDLVYDSLGLPLKITEFDLTGFANDELEGQYTRDFLTAVFANPNVEAFLTWGFWDGAHWRENAPFFDIDWELKPSGRAMLDLMFEEWSTDTTLVTDANGIVDLRGFKGEYEITTGVDGTNDAALAGQLTLSNDTTLQLALGVVALDEVTGLSPKPVAAPNPTRDDWSVSNLAARAGVSLYDLQGRRLWHGQVRSDGSLTVPAAGLRAGVYVLRVGNRALRLVRE